MFTLRVSALFAVLALSTAACAVDAEPDGKDEKAPAVDTSGVSTTQYVPKITLQDLKEAGATCSTTGSVCLLGGRTYYCTAAGACTVVETPSV